MTRQIPNPERPGENYGCPRFSPLICRPGPRELSEGGPVWSHGGPWRLASRRLFNRGWGLPDTFWGGIGLGGSVCGRRQPPPWTWSAEGVGPWEIACEVNTDVEDENLG